MWDKAFFVILGSRCNLSCRHCYNEADVLKRGVGGDDFLSRQRLEPLFDALAEQGYGKVFLSGGEPLLHDDIAGIAAAASRRGLTVAAFSNGELLDADLIGRLAEAGLKELRISLNELCWTASARARDTVLARKTRWTEALIAHGIAVGYVSIISAFNIDHIVPTLRRLRGLGAGVKLQPLFLPPDMADRRAACTGIPAAKWEQLIADLAALCDETDLGAESRRFPVYGNPWKLVRYVRFLADYFVNGRHPDFCPTGPLLVVGPDGAVHPCLFRFDLALGDLDHPSGLRSLDAAMAGHRDLRHAPCFGEYCLSAYR